MKTPMKTPNRRTRLSMLPASGTASVHQRISAFETGGVSKSTSKSFSKSASGNPLKNVKNIIARLETGFKNDVEQKKAALSIITGGHVSSKLVRTSKFRHIFCSQSTTNSFSSNVCLPFTEKPLFDVGLRFCAVALKHHFLVFGRHYSTSPEVFVDGVHASIGPAADGVFDGVKIIDLSWNRLRPEILAFSGTGGSVQIWKAVEAWTFLQPPTISRIKNLRHSKDVHLLRWHPKVCGILLGASSPDHVVSIWDVFGSRSKIAEIKVADDLIGGVSWSVDGAFFASACKQGFVRVFAFRTSGMKSEDDVETYQVGPDDSSHRQPRAQSDHFPAPDVVVETHRFRANSAKKSFDLVVLKDGRIFTSGLTFSSAREIALWDNPFMSSLSSTSSSSFASGEAGDEVPLYRLSLNEATVEGTGGCPMRKDASVGLFHRGTSNKGVEWSSIGAFLSRMESVARGVESVDLKIGSSPPRKENCPLPQNDYLPPREYCRPIFRETMDHGTGCYRPIYDPELGLVYLMAKGESGFRVFEFSDEKPYVHFLTRHISTFSSSNYQSADFMAALPTSGLNSAVCEIQRFFRLDVARKRFEEFSVRVPRRYPNSFKSDLYRGQARLTTTTSTATLFTGGSLDDGRENFEMDRKVFGC